MDVKEICLEKMQGICVDHDRENWQDFVNMVMKLRFPKNWAKLFVICRSASCYSMTRLRRVI